MVLGSYPGPGHNIAGESITKVNYNIDSLQKTSASKAKLFYIINVIEQTYAKNWENFFSSQNLRTKITVFPVCHRN